VDLPGLLALTYGLLASLLTPLAVSAVEPRKVILIIFGD
jgi:hypothetical protein